MKLAIAPLVFGSAAATSVISAHSKVGKNLLHRARRLDGDGAEISWAVNYSLRFEKCATSTDYYGGYFGGNQDDNDNENNNYNGVYEQRLVHFKLCPTDSCGSGCSDGGDYVIDMTEFVQAYMEYKQEAQEQECESVANNCYCENANDDDACAAQCYMNAGIYEQCVDQDNNNNNNNGQQQDEFELEEALECAQLDLDEEAAQYYMYNNQDGNGNGNNYYNGNNNQNGGDQEIEFFVGPYCSANGKSILLGVFMDEMCSYAAPTGIYEKFHYGNALPYSTKSIISNDCISCMQPAEDDGNNNNNQNYNYNNGNDDANNNYNYNQNQNQEEPEVLEICERLYEEAGKCESSLNVYGLYSNTMGCDFIKSLGKTSVFASLSNAKASATPKVLAVLFASSTLVFGGVSYYFHKKLQRQSVGLVHSGGNMA